ncbi:MAG TPA: UDP-N-acetylglucosamine--N-acetylmuramyl-(pentapeptide) pyrophosphoryl-undecaprenol N-acetylglucosamine transferase [Acidimicrobiales bacterium]
MTTARPWAIIAGGGTGGHITPAIAIGRALVSNGRSADEILFVGGRHGIERRMVPDAGFEIVTLAGRGIERRLSLRAVRAVVSVVAGTVAGVWLVIRRRPAVVVSVGGYAAVPCIVGAALARIPVVLAEANAVPGAANRLAARICRCVSAVTFPGTPLPSAHVTGNPVRPEVVAVDRTGQRDAARAELGVPLDRRLVLVFGGSLGARRINESVRSALLLLAHPNEVAIHHVVGARDWPAWSADPPAGPDDVHYRSSEFEERLARWYEAAELAVTRAGGSTVAELACAGLPSILVPLPDSPGDHQTANARAMADAGAAVWLTDAELTGERLAAHIDDLVRSPSKLDEMSAAARSVARPDAAARVADLVEVHARRAKDGA